MVARLAFEHADRAERRRTLFPDVDAQQTTVTTRPFTYYLRVRYGECDAQKVVFNARYGDYVDVAVNEFFRALGCADALINGALDFQLVKQTTEWKASARFDQVLALSISVQHLGNTSFTLRTEFRVHGADRLIAIVDTVYVLVDSKTLKKTPIPDSLRAAMTEGAAGKTANHAG
jgi:acyl-CoA thioester hydrolase